MITRDLQFEINGKKYSGFLGTVRDTMLGTEDHGIFTFNITVEGGGSGVGIGNRFLDTVAERKRGEAVGERFGTARGMSLIMETLRVAGVSSWEQLKGKHLIPLFEGESRYTGVCVGFAHATEDRALIFEEFTKEWEAKHGE